MSKIIFAVVSLLWMGACKNKVVDVPFSNEGQSFPSTVRAARYSEPKKLSWTLKSTGVKPQIKKFDFEKLPVSVYDSSDFLKSQKPPLHNHFNLDSIPSRPFNLYALPSKSFRFHTQILEQPKLIFKTSKPRIVNSSSGLLYEFGEPLAGTHITCIFKDRIGLLWIANQQGVYRYDGEALSLIIEGGLVPSVYSMIEDARGRLWIGTQGNGIIILDTHAGIFKQISISQGLASDAIGRMETDNQGRYWIAETSSNTANGVDVIDADSLIIRHIGKTEGLASNYVGGVARDSSGNIWIGNLQGGVDIFDLRNNSIKNLGVSNGLNMNVVSSLLVDKQKRIWLAGFNADVSMIDLQHQSITQYYKDPNLKRVMIWDMTEDNKGNIWSVTYGNNVEGKGVFVIDPVKERIKNINMQGGLSSHNVEWVKEDNLGQIWIGTILGLNMFNRNGNNIEHVGKRETGTLAMDSRGLLWIGTTSKGIDILDRTTGLTKTFSSKYGLANDSLEYISEKNGEIFICSNGGLDIIDSARKAFRHYGKKQGFTNDLVANFMLDARGRIWVSNNNGFNGFDLLDEKNGTIEHIDIPDEKKKVPGISDFKQDEKGMIWIGFNSGAVGIIDPVNKTIKYLLDAIEVHEINNMELLFDVKGNIWIGTETGIYIVTEKRDSVFGISTRQGLTNNEILSLNQYAGRIYAGTRAGLSIIYLQDSGFQKIWRIKSFGSADGVRKLASTIESDYISDKGDFIWGDLGLTIINYSGNRKTISPVYITGFDIFNQSQSFSNRAWPDINDNDTIWTTRKDKFYFKNKMPSELSQPFPRHAEWDSIIDPYNLPVNLKLPYDNNYLQFHFVQADLGSHDTTQYQYILEGADQKWSDITNNTFSQNYLNLPSGDYIFKVTARSKGSEWATPASFNFSIAPPWWLTWWAYTIWALLFVTIIVSIINFRSKQLLRENSMLEDRVAQRTRELKVEKEKAEVTLAELRSTQSQLIQSEKMASLGELTAGIAHEIQNPLNFVNNFSDVNTELIDEITEAIDAGNFSEAKELMSNVRENEVKIKYHGHRAEAIVKSMLQHSRISTGQMEPTDINALADEYLRLSYHGLRAKDKSFNANMETDFDPAVGKITINQQEIGRVLLNLYNNAFYVVNEKKKQHPENYEPIVFVSTKRMGDRVAISVRDNGNGIPQKVIDKIFQPFFTTKPAGQGTGLGLSMSYDIVKAHKGELKVHTREEEGSEFVILLPLT
jgi:signal transduction histidine kinase/ligand-binding sensor domain-containing protein